MVTIKLKHRLTERQIAWLSVNVGERTHYLNMSIGGKGWRSTYQRSEWVLRFDDDRYASWFMLKFS